MDKSFTCEEVDIVSYRKLSQEDLKEFKPMKFGKEINSKRERREKKNRERKTPRSVGSPTVGPISPLGRTAWSLSHLYKISVFGKVIPLTHGDL